MRKCTCGGQPDLKEIRYESSGFEFPHIDKYYECMDCHRKGRQATEEIEAAYHWNMMILLDLIAGKC